MPAPSRRVPATRRRPRRQSVPHRARRLDRPDGRPGRPAGDAVDHGVRAGSDPRALPGAARSGEPPVARGTTGAAHRRFAQRAAYPVARCAEPRHGARLPLVRRRCSATQPARSPGQRRRALAARPQDLWRRRRGLRLLPVDRRRDRGAGRRRPTGHGYLCTGRRHDRRDLRLHPQRPGLRLADRHPTFGRTVTRGLAHAPEPRSCSHRRLDDRSVQHQGRPRPRPVRGREASALEVHAGRGQPRGHRAARRRNTYTSVPLLGENQP